MLKKGLLTKFIILTFAIVSTLLIASCRPGTPQGKATAALEHKLGNSVTEKETKARFVAAVVAAGREVTVETVLVKWHYYAHEKSGEKSPRRQRAIEKMKNLYELLLACIVPSDAATLMKVWSSNNEVLDMIVLNSIRDFQDPRMMPLWESVAADTEKYPRCESLSGDTTVTELLIRRNVRSVVEETVVKIIENPTGDLCDKPLNEVKKLLATEQNRVFVLTVVEQTLDIEPLNGVALDLLAELWPDIYAAYLLKTMKAMPREVELARRLFELDPAYAAEPIAQAAVRDRVAAGDGAEWVKLLSLFDEKAYHAAVLNLVKKDPLNGTNLQMLKEAEGENNYKTKLYNIFLNDPHNLNLIRLMGTEQVTKALDRLAAVVRNPKVERRTEVPSRCNSSPCIDDYIDGPHGRTKSLICHQSLALKILDPEVTAARSISITNEGEVAAAIEALGNMGDKRALPALKKAAGFKIAELECYEIPFQFSQLPMIEFKTVCPNIGDFLNGHQCKHVPVPAEPRGKWNTRDESQPFEEEAQQAIEKLNTK